MASSMDEVHVSMLYSTDGPEEGNNSDILFQIHYNEDQHWQQATSA